MGITLALLLAMSAPAARSQPAERPAAQTPNRQLAEGVLRTIEPELRVGDTFSRHDLIELLNQSPDYDWAKQVRFEHDLWALEFSFKPLRLVEIELPGKDRRLERKLVWYLIYRVRNLGDKPVPFYPVFVLDSQNTGKQYVDRILPAAVPSIERRESPPARLRNTVEIAGEMPVAGSGRDVWGVVTWEGIDPRTDRISIYVEGLTNAYKWEENAKGKDRLAQKALQLNFWRPGDQHFEHEAEIRSGIPGEVDYQWVYR